MSRIVLVAVKGSYLGNTLVLLIALFCAGCTCFSIPLVDRERSLDETVVAGKGKDKIVLIDISGVLSSKEKKGLLALQHEASIVARVREELKKAAQDKQVKGLILRINTPGGTVTSSDIIYREIKRFKDEMHVPVVACMMEVATSGGYYVALSADTIVAHPTSVTGSIGVIALKFNAKGLMEKIGIEDETIMAGDKKDLFSPFRPITEEEKVIVKNMLNDFHQRFMNVVAEGRRGLDREEIKKVADGRVFTAGQALEEKLIDEIGYLDDVIAVVKKKADIADAKVIMYHRPYSYKNNIYSRMMTSDLTTINLLNIDLQWLLDDTGLRFMYLWFP
jgi:protease-4